MNQAISSRFFTDSGVLDLNASNDAQNRYIDGNDQVYDMPNKGASGIRFIALEMNPLNNVGKLSYWQNPGGNYTESARGFVFNIEAKEDGALKGCATTGAVVNTSIRNSLIGSVGLVPNGYWHPFLLKDASGSDADGAFFTRGSLSQPQNYSKWYVPVGSDPNLATFAQSNQGSLVTRQCFTQNATTGLYEIDAAAMEAPAAGFELITTSSAKFIAPPALQGVRPFEGRVKE